MKIAFTFSRSQSAAPQISYDLGIFLLRELPAILFQVLALGSFGLRAGPFLVAAPRGLFLPLSMLDRDEPEYQNAYDHKESVPAEEIEWHQKR